MVYFVDCVDFFGFLGLLCRLCRLDLYILVYEVDCGGL